MDQDLDWVNFRQEQNSEKQEREKSSSWMIAKNLLLLTGPGRDKKLTLQQYIHQFSIYINSFID